MCIRDSSSSAAGTARHVRRGAGVLFIALLRVAGVWRCKLRRGRHFQHLDALVVITPGVERQAERQCQSRRSVEIAMRAIDQLEADAFGRRLILPFLREMRDGQKAGDRQHHCTDDGDHRRHPALPDLPFETHAILPGKMLKNRKSSGTIESIWANESHEVE